VNAARRLLKFHNSVKLSNHLNSAITAHKRDSHNNTDVTHTQKGSQHAHESSAQIPNPRLTNKDHSTVLYTRVRTRNQSRAISWSSHLSATLASLNSFSISARIFGGIRLSVTSTESTAALPALRTVLPRRSLPSPDIT
jgi:hypothetical protein